MRAWLEALGKSLPSLEITDPEGEVASAFKVSINFNGERESGGKRRRGWHYQSTCGKRRWERGLAGDGGLQASGVGRQNHNSIQQFLYILPADEDDVIGLQSLLEFGAGDDVIVALAPGCAVVGMIRCYSLEFGVVVAEVDDDFGHAGFQVLDRIQVEGFPVRGRHRGIRDHDGVDRIGRASCRE